MFQIVKNGNEMHFACTHDLSKNIHIFSSTRYEYH